MKELEPKKARSDLERQEEGTWVTALISGSAGGKSLEKGMDTAGGDPANRSDAEALKLRSSRILQYADGADEDEQVVSALSLSRGIQACDTAGDPANRSDAEALKLRKSRILQYADGADDELVEPEGGGVPDGDAHAIPPEGQPAEPIVGRGVAVPPSSSDGIPGAFAEAPDPIFRRASTDSDISSVSVVPDQRWGDDSSAADDPVAEPVMDELSGFLHMAPPAQEIDLEARGAAEALKQRQMGFFFGLALVFVVALCLLVAFSVANSGERSDGNPASQISTPSPTWLSPMDWLYSLLPNDTIAAMHHDDTSPQAQAWRWIEKDSNLTSYGTGDRLLQRFVLATLYFATDGEIHWHRKDGWLSHDLHECQWEFSPNTGLHWVLALDKWVPRNMSELEGISPCDENGNYERLWLSANHLKGRLPVEVFLLTNLRELDLSSNKDFLGVLPSQVTQLTRLEFLNLRSSGHTGTIPSEIGLVHSLTSFEMHTNALTGTIPTEIAQLDKLEILYLGPNQLSGTLPSEIGRMNQSLHTLNLHGNKLSGTIPTEFGNMAAMGDLHLEENQLTGTIISEFGNLPLMYHLFLYTNHISGTIPTQLGRCKNMMEIEIEDNMLTGTLPTELGLLSMDFFYPPYNPLSGTIPTEYGRLTEMKDLWFGNTDLTGTIPTELGLLSQLLGLSLANTSLTGTIPVELGLLATRGALIGLNVAESNFSGTMPLGLCWLEDGLSNKTFPSDFAWYSGESFLEFDCSPPVLCGCGCDCYNYSSAAKIEK